mmetsp:Transcript_1252/g.1786  ORF Transcript_1252/g.1786 Transcript_1252/m.1786 type:complete len:616 (-) Transcript_1252:64-1911(-)
MIKMRFRQRDKKKNTNRGDDRFSARRSGRANTRMEADQDTWTEHLAVVETKLPKKAEGNGQSATNELSARDQTELQIRSLFESRLTGQRVWDEPPSGASNIIFLSEEARKMAEKQKNELRVTTVSTDPLQTTSNRNDVQNHQNGRIGRFFGTKTKPRSAEMRQISYKPDSKFAPTVDNSYDTQMRIAIQRSLDKKRDLSFSIPSDLARETDDESLALAMALSLSEANNNQTHSSGSFSSNDISVIEISDVHDAEENLKVGELGNVCSNKLESKIDTDQVHEESSTSNQDTNDTNLNVSEFTTPVPNAEISESTFMHFNPSVCGEESNQKGANFSQVDGTLTYSHVHETPNYLAKGTDETIFIQDKVSNFEIDSEKYRNKHHQLSGPCKKVDEHYLSEKVNDKGDASMNCNPKLVFKGGKYERLEDTSTGLAENNGGGCHLQVKDETVFLNESEMRVYQDKNLSSCNSHLVNKIQKEASNFEESEALPKGSNNGSQSENENEILNTNIKESIPCDSNVEQSEEVMSSNSNEFTKAKMTHEVKNDILSICAKVHIIESQSLDDKNGCIENVGVAKEEQNISVHLNSNFNEEGYGSGSNEDNLLCVDSRENFEAIGPS